MRCSSRAFTILELIVVLAVIGALLAIAAPVIGFQITQNRVSAEMAALQNLATAAQASFESTDLEGTNLAALTGSVPTGTDTTNFSPSTSPAYAPSAVNTYDWFVKVARQMGYSLQGTTFPAAAVPAPVATILYNPNNNARFMLLGPATEPTAQRFLIVSLIAAGGPIGGSAAPEPIEPAGPGKSRPLQRHLEHELVHHRRSAAAHMDLRPDRRSGAGVAGPAMAALRPAHRLPQVQPHDQQYGSDPQLLRLL